MNFWSFLLFIPFFCQGIFAMTIHEFKSIGSIIVQVKEGKNVKFSLQPEQYLQFFPSTFVFRIPKQSLDDAIVPDTFDHVGMEVYCVDNSKGNVPLDPTGNSNVYIMQQGQENTPAVSPFHLYRGQKGTFPVFAEGVNILSETEKGKFYARIEAKDVPFTPVTFFSAPPDESGVGAARFSITEPLIQYYEFYF